MAACIVRLKWASTTDGVSSPSKVCEVCVHRVIVFTLIKESCKIINIPYEVQTIDMSCNKYVADI